MAGYAAYPALLTDLAHEWALNNTKAGWISGSYFLGYALAVPVLVSLTDRVDAKRIYVGSMATAAVAALMFAVIANGLWSALILQALMGVGLAGTYMPGLKLLADHITGPRQSRAVAFYTACFSIGGGVSFLMTGHAATLLGWRGAFLSASVSALLAVVLVWVMVPATRTDRRDDGASMTACRVVRCWIFARSFAIARPLDTRSAMAVIAGNCSACAVGWSLSLPLRPVGMASMG